MAALFSESKNLTLLEPKVTIKIALNGESEQQLAALADALLA